MKPLVDMNLSPTWIDRLNKTGFHAVHWSGMGRLDAPDSEIIAYAATHDYVVLMQAVAARALALKAERRSAAVQ